MRNLLVHYQIRLTIFLALIGALVLFLLKTSPAGKTLSRTAPSTGTPTTEAVYPYHSPAFTQLVDESFQRLGGGTATTFYTWMEQAYRKTQWFRTGKEQLTLEQLLDREAMELPKRTQAATRTRAEVELASWLHTLVKKAIPKFSLERGFEFSHTVRYGERQCLLQSVLLAGMLQRAGVEAGVVMIFRNNNGVESNNGHAATLLKLTDGRDVILDASDPTPFIPHQGVFARLEAYRFVRPIYAPKSPYITQYRGEGKRDLITPAQLHPLDFAFLQSQFWYYRGERAAGGIFTSHPTTAGLTASQTALEKSVALCPQNPLAVYMLGRTYLRQGKTAQAKETLTRAHQWYARFGWEPEGPREMLARVTHP